MPSGSVEARPTRSALAGTRAVWRAADGEFAMNLLKQIENEQMAKLTAGKEIPDFQPGDTVLVNVKVVEGERSRAQRELHRAQDLLRRGRRARVPALFADDRFDQGRTPWQGAPRQALLSA